MYPRNILMLSKPCIYLRKHLLVCYAWLCPRKFHRGRVYLNLEVLHNYQLPFRVHYRWTARTSRYQPKSIVRFQRCWYQRNLSMVRRYWGCSGSYNAKGTLISVRRNLWRTCRGINYCSLIDTGQHWQLIFTDRYDNFKQTWWVDRMKRACHHSLL